jgi:hypothetical protein
VGGGHQGENYEAEHEPEEKTTAAAQGDVKKKVPEGARQTEREELYLETH